MFRFLRGVVLIAAIVLNCGFAFAEQRLNSANAIADGCRAVALRTIPPDMSALVGECVGIIEGIVYTPPQVCIGHGVILGQEVRIVVKYIDERPERQQESFMALALEALQAAWPCKK